MLMWWTCDLGPESWPSDEPDPAPRLRHGTWPGLTRRSLLTSRGVQASWRADRASSPGPVSQSRIIFPGPGTCGLWRGSGPLKAGTLVKRSNEPGLPGNVTDSGRRGIYCRLMRNYFATKKNSSLSVNKLQRQLKKIDKKLSSLAKRKEPWKW